MKIKNIREPKKLFETLAQCKGSVELRTEEGDRLNMKSKLCQYIAMTDIFSNAEIGEIEIMVSEPEDVALLIDFMIKG